MWKRRVTLIALLIVLGFVITSRFTANGFDLKTHSIPTDEILSGGPAKDAIPSLTAPLFVGASDAVFLEDSDIVLGVEVGGKAKAYPIKILNWHEAVNDKLGGRNILATW
jgi:hypothetical protein